MMPYISSNTSSIANLFSGMVRHNNNNFEVYDGTNWRIVAAAYPSVELSSTANSVINWAMNKMAEEKELEALAHSHPAVKAAYDNMLLAAAQLKTTIILSKDEST